MHTCPAAGPGPGAAQLLSPLSVLVVWLCISGLALQQKAEVEVAPEGGKLSLLGLCIVPRHVCQPGFPGPLEQREMREGCSHLRVVWGPAVPRLWHVTHSSPRADGLLSSWHSPCQRKPGLPCTARAAAFLALSTMSHQHTGSPPSLPDTLPTPASTIAAGTASCEIPWPCPISMVSLTDLLFPDPHGEHGWKFAVGGKQRDPALGAIWITRVYLIHNKQHIFQSGSV